MGKDKEKDGFDGVANFKAKHSCYSLVVTEHFIVVGGTKVHFFDRQSYDHVKEIKTGHDVSAMCFLDGKLHVGLSDGNISQCEIGDKPPESMDPLKKQHSAAICCLKSHKDRLFSGCVDGSLTVWEAGNIVGTRPKPEKKKAGKNNMVYFFPEKDLCVAALQERVYLFKNLNFEDEDAASLLGIDHSVKAITGYYTASGVRCFIGCDDGSISIFDLSPQQEGAVHATQQLEKLHSKTIHCLTMFGPYLIATAHDKLVSMWNGKETSSECNLIRKFQHKGAVTAIFVEGSPEDDNSHTWCFDESNKKIYKIVMSEHLPSLSKGHQPRLTFEVDPTAEPQPAEAEILSPRDSETGSVKDEEKDVQVTHRMKYKDFFSDTGTLQALFDSANIWLAKHPDLKVLSVNTVPIIGAKHSSDALFKHSINQAAYDAALRTKPEHSVPVVQVVRVVYLQ